MRRSTDPTTGLTPKMEAFCLVLARTGNASEAYRKAYNAKNMKPETICRRAADLVASGKIAARLSQLRSDAREKAGITLAEHLRDLKVLRNLATTARQYSPAVSAEMARGKVSGLYEPDSEGGEAPPPVKVEVIVRDGRKG